MKKSGPNLPIRKPSVNDKLMYVGGKDAIKVPDYQLLPRGGRTTASRDSYKDIDTHTSIRTGMDRKAYEQFRPFDTLPYKPKDIIYACMEAYKNIGLIRNIIDLMSDFGVQGIRLNHTNKRIQKFYRAWFEKVNGPERSERFLSLLYRAGMVVMKRSMAKLTTSNEDKMKKRVAADHTPDIDVIPDEKVQKRVIPYSYIILNPLTLDVVGEELSAFVGKTSYIIKVNQKLKSSILTPKSEQEKELIKSLPFDLVQSIKSGNMIVPLDMNKIISFYYKKDDWDIWPDPMIHAILDDLILLEKMKLADLAALDGAISQVRIWKLGDIESKLFPTDAAINKLSEILLSNPGGGAFDIIWGPDLKLEESKTSIHQFLGSTKYEPVMNSIYEGLGVPTTLTGSTSSGGATNNYISLKTLVQRLEYGRGLLKKFWNNEIELVRQAMGFQRGATVEFDNMILSDEAAEKALLIQLADRDIISLDTVLERFGEIPEVEELKLRREKRARKAELLPNKAGPWHTPQQIYELTKIALQKGVVTPEQVGVEVDDEYYGQETPFDRQLKSIENRGKVKEEDNKGIPQQGRPLNSKDKKKRKNKEVKPVGANLAGILTTMTWAKGVYNTISSIVTEAMVKSSKKKNVRELTNNQINILEKAKFVVLSNLKPFSNVDVETIYNIVNNKMDIPANINMLYNKMYASLLTHKNKELTIDEVRNLQMYVYSIINSYEGE